jgi:hypothetical protein
MALLQCLQILFMALDGRFKLLDVLCSSLTKSSLSLTISLLSFFGCGVYLDEEVSL